MFLQFYLDPVNFLQAKFFKFFNPLYVNNKFSVKSKTHKNKKIYVDVSVIIQSDAGTGIQRVVRSISENLKKIANESDDLDVYFIYATRKRPYRILKKSKPCTDDPYYEGESGDVFFGLDWSAHILYNNEAQLLSWKKKGVQLSFVVYDMLPQENPEWFTPATVKKHKAWFKAICRYADQLLCISNDVRQKVNSKLSLTRKNHNIKISTIPMGYDITTSNELNKQEIDTKKFGEYALVVGTLEPRKGHMDVLTAFTELWENYESNLNLVIIGKNGWCNDIIKNQIKKSIYLNQKIFWLDKINDFELIQFYKNCSLMVVPSLAEGYGLPLVEAMKYNKKIICRNIPIFYEISKGNCSFFKEIADLKLLIKESKLKINYKKEHYPTWFDCTTQLLEKLT